ncbi:MAG: prolyl oligopeptidase family serine peptidase [Planctomycetota bacterium]
MKNVLPLALLAVLCNSLFADGPKDNQIDSIRVIPPAGIEVDREVAEALRNKCHDVRKRWDEIVEEFESEVRDAKKWQRNAKAARLEKLRCLGPEVLVFPRAVELALEFQQFYRERDFEAANAMLDLAMRRAESCVHRPEWNAVVGLQDTASQQLIVGGFESKIDGSHQPYAIVVPPGFRDAADVRPRRLDVWFHGRGETLSEMSFLEKGLQNAGQYAPNDTFVLHPYGRYSNAFKFAGEIDVLEALRYVSSRLPVDERRVSARGFSMGGAACWQFATHYPDRFFAANPGAGFSETPEFLKSFQGEDLSATPSYERKLWRLYDCPPWSRNLIHCPTVAYSGEIDRQKQAADVMQAALAKHQIDLVHVIGPETAHKIHPDSKAEIERRMDRLAKTVPTRLPNVIDFTTFTTRYHRLHWVEVHGLQQHWERGHVVARRDESSVAVKTLGVTHLRLSFASGEWEGDFPARPKLAVDGQALNAPAVRSDRSWQVDLIRDGDRWRIGRLDELGDLRKRPGLQGPIDDAFMDTFVFVTPSGRSKSDATDRWIRKECDHAKLHWRKHFRGDVVEIKDTELTPESIADRHLVLFGEPESNAVLAQIQSQLPVTWTDESIELGDRTFPRQTNAIAMIYPNPLNPERYIVLNTGFTFREYDYLNNARQTPKLPDWAIIDTVEGANGRYPGEIRDAGFFDERWQVER